MKFFKSFLMTITFMTLVIFSLSGANIDINANVRSFAAETSSDPAIIEIFKEVDRYRTYEFNRDLIHLNDRNIGETMRFTFFEDKQYSAEILKAEINDAGRRVITARFLESDFGYAIITLSENAITLSAKVPENDEFFFASVKNGQAYLGQARLSEMAKDELPCGVLDEPHEFEHSKEHDCEMTRNDVIIDLLYVYTAAAALWAENDWRVTNIHHLIDVAQAVSNLVMSNSETGIIFNIVHRHQTDYVEVNSGDDLQHLTDPYDGYLDEVHVLRDVHGADLIVFIPEVDFTGGVAWLLWSFQGFMPDYYAVSLSRVQQSSWSYTVVHEIGHNMGAHHHRDQNFQGGPNFDLGNYSSGWRGSILDIMRTTVMSYDSGQYYTDGINAYRIPYFSSPLINLYGTMIGNAALADNARLLRETKGVTSNYRNRPGGNIFLDLSAESLTGSTSISVNKPAKYTMRVINLGTYEAFSYTVHLMESESFMPVVSIYDGPDLMPGEYMDFDLIWTPTTVGQALLWGHIQWDWDENIYNQDTPWIFVTIHPTGTLLLENFDSEMSYFALGWDGRINSSSGIFDNSGVGGSKALAMSVWENSEWQNAITPEIGPVSSDSVLSFSYRIINYTTDWYAPVTPHVLGSGDVVCIEVSTEFNSLSYTPIYQIDMLNHINSTDFSTINLSLAAFADEYINIRFNVERATGSWFFVLDDVSVQVGEMDIFLPPQNLVAIAGNQIVDLSWNAPTDGSSGTLLEYILYRGTSANDLNPHATLPLSLQIYEDTELTNGMTYFYQISAIYTEPAGESLRIPMTPVQAIPYVWNPPQNLTLVVGNGQVTLNWQRPESGGASLSGYKIFRGTTEENMVEIHNITSNQSPNMSWVNNTDIISGESYYFGIKASYSTPTIGDSEYSNIENSGPVSDDDGTIFPVRTALESNFPNPFNPETMIRFAISANTMVVIDIFNIRGQMIRTLVNDFFDRGFHSVVWDGNDGNGNPMSSGIYFYRMTTNEYASVRRMLLIK